MNSVSIEGQYSRARGWLPKLVAGLSCCACLLDAATFPAGFSPFLVADGILNPTAMEFAPDGRLFVCQQGGQLRVVKNLSLLPAPFLTVTTDSSGERGLLGIAFDPDFANNNFLYVYYTATSPTIHNRVSRFTANGDVVIPGSEVAILDLEDLGASNHNGGAIHFGTDGKLYVAVGENAVPSTSQTLANRLGKILRIDRDGSIPADNPFYGTATGLNRAIWALGLRNPFTFGVQPGTGRIFINDVGAGGWEEISEGLPGANYGWPNCEGKCSTFNPSYRDPVFQYAHGPLATNGCAITGGAFYDPVAAQFPGIYRGSYFFADSCGGWIRRLNPAAGNGVSDFASGIPGPVDLKVSAEGRLFYLVRNTGQVWAVDFTDAPPSLGILRPGANVLILWPAPSAGFVLRSSPSLPAATWSTVPGVLITNGQNRALITPANAARFYRLARP